LACAGAFIALAVSAHLGLLNTFDSVIREWARPNDVWGTLQMRADYVVEGLRPAMIASLLAAFTVALCLIRRSLRPLLFVGVVGLTTVVLTVTAKMAVGRPDTHGTTADSHGGSFPSGHIIAVVVCLGLVLLMTQPRAGRWVWLFPALVGGLMGVCILVQAAHWSTDVVGGGLLAVGVLTAVPASGWDRWSLGPAGKTISPAPASAACPSTDARPAMGRR
jgi:membrane-associated phospholipid phosphatase